MIETGAGADVDAYIDDVISGRIVTGELERLMVERHLRDIESGPDRGLVWAPELGLIVVDFCEMLQHSKGKWAGKQLRLEPWQKFLVTALYGWILAEDGTRRFRRAYWEVARKNGKSTLAAALALFALIADGEGGPEVYCGATKREQAKIIFEESRRMANASRVLREAVTVHQHSIFVPGTAGRFVTLSADDKHASGHNTHFAIMDELHEHRTDELWNVIGTSMGSREQPMLLSTTTAGEDPNSLCGRERDFAERVLRGTVVADEFFPAIYAIDAEEEWQDEDCWRKANPNLGVSVFVRELRGLASEAADSLVKLRSFLRYKMNVWVSSASRWFRPEVWDACRAGDVDAVDLSDRPCYGGLDLASNEDVAAFVLLFPPHGEDDKYRVLCRFFVPHDSVSRRSQQVSVPYDVWVREGHLTATPGPVIDYKWIYASILADAAVYDLVDIGFDRYGAARVYTEMEEHGITMVQVGQGFVSMSGPSKELHRLVLSGQLTYFDNPVMRWMGHNVVVVEDPAANIKPDKNKSKEKIDGVVALIMALDRSMRHKSAGKSVYEERGMSML